MYRQTRRKSKRAAAQIFSDEKYNLARACLDGGEVDEANQLLEALVDANPDQLQYGLDLAQCYLSLQYWRDARQLIEDVLNQAHNQATGTADQIEKQRGRLQKRARWQAEEDTAVAEGGAKRVS